MEAGGDHQRFPDRQGRLGAVAEQLVATDAGIQIDPQPQCRRGRVGSGAIDLLDQQLLVGRKVDRGKIDNP